MRLALGSDHAGLDLKTAVAVHLRAAGHEVDDVGTHDAASCHYPTFASRVARSVADGTVDRGVLVCGTGQGMAMAANKVPGVRAAVVSDPFSAAMAMEHNDARVLCLGARVVGVGLALTCLDAWLHASFAGGRHAERIALFDPSVRP